MFTGGSQDSECRVTVPSSQEIPMGIQGGKGIDWKVIWDHINDFDW